MTDVVRVPRYLAADWQRLKRHLEEEKVRIGDASRVTDAFVLSSAVAVALLAMKVPGATGIVPEEGLPYEVPAEEPAAASPKIRAEMGRLLADAFREGYARGGEPIKPAPDAED